MSFVECTDDIYNVLRASRDAGGQGPPHLLHTPADLGRNGGGKGRKIIVLSQGGSTRSAGLAPCSSKHLAAPRHRLEAAMCRAEPWLKSLHVEFTTGRRAREILVSVFDTLGIPLPSSLHLLTSC